MEYKIVSANKREAMESIIASYITIGWIPQGGVCVDEGMLYQALIKEEKK